MDETQYPSRLFACVVALVTIAIGGCAGLPRIDPSGQQVFIWPGQQPNVATAPGLVTTPTTTFATPPGNQTVAPVFTNNAVPGSVTAAATQPFGSTGTGVANQANREQLPAGYLGITPSRVLAPIGSEVVLRGAVCGENGYLQTNRRVEWMLDRRGTGQIVTVGNRYELDMFRNPFDMPRKIDNSYVIGTTSPFYKCIDRGTADPTDDLQIRSGESWISVTSPVEGTSYVTAYMPSVDDWNGRTARATIYWVDVEWTLPQSRTLAPGERHTLTTTVTRQSDGTPLPGWIVRYTVQGGGAGLGYDVGSTIEEKTDASGRASVEVTPTDSRPGTTTINVEVIRPEQTTVESSPRVTLGGGDVTLTWGAGGSIGTPLPPRSGGTPIFTEPSPSDNFPPLGGGGGGVGDGVGGGLGGSTPTPTDDRRADLQLSVEPVGLGPYQKNGTVQFDAVITNRGDASARINKVIVEFDPGLKHSAAAPGEPFIKIEQPFDLGPGESETLPTLTFDIVGSGRQCISVKLETDSLVPPARRCIDVIEPAPAARPTLRVVMDGPLQLNQGENANIKVVVENTSNVAAQNVVIAVTTDDAFRPVASSDDLPRLADGLTWQVPTIEPGGRRTVEIESRCEQPAARACHRVRVTANGDVVETAETCTEIRPALGGPALGGPGTGGPAPGPAAANDGGVPVALEYPGARSRVGDPSTLFVRVTNRTNQTQRNVTLQILVPPQFQVDLQRMQPAFTGQTRQIEAGTELTFPVAAQLAPGTSLDATIPLVARQAGSSKILARRQADGLAELIVDTPADIRDRQ